MQREPARDSESSVIPLSIVSVRDSNAPEELHLKSKYCRSFEAPEVGARSHDRLSELSILQGYPPRRAFVLEQLHVMNRIDPF